jgi:hypothetical protein
MDNLIINSKDIEEVMKIAADGMTYSEFEQLLSNPKYERVINSIDLYLWTLCYGYYIPGKETRISTIMPSAVNFMRIIMKISPHYKDKLFDNVIINSELCMLDINIPKEVVNIILDNSIFMSNAIIYWCEGTSIHTDLASYQYNYDTDSQYLEKTKELQRLVTIVNERSIKKFDYFAIRQIFDTSKKSPQMYLRIPIKCKIELNYPASNRNELIRALCLPANSYFQLQADFICIAESKYNFSKQYYDFQMAPELFGEYDNEALRIVCGYVIECIKHYNKMFWSCDDKYKWYWFCLSQYITDGVTKTAFELFQKNNSKVVASNIPTSIIINPTDFH